MKTKYQVFHTGYLGNDPWETEAYDHAEAAEQYGEHFDSDGDYTLASGRDEIVVRVVGDGVEKLMKVVGETIPHYSAKEVRK
jgi:hypothetical protein